MLNISTNEIWEEFGGLLKGFIIKRVKNKSDAEDILQDIFFKIHNNIHNLKSEDALEAWVYQITRNTIIDYYRQRKNVVEYPIEAVGDEIDKGTPKEDVCWCIRPMVEDLPEKYSQAILLTEYEGLSQQEMASKMGLSLSGAKSRVQRAREKLKEMLLECCNL